MAVETVILKNEDGLHARAAALFVRSANQYKSEITLEAHGDKVNGKSIIGLMSLGAKYNEELKISAEGPDEDEAIDNLVKLIENNFIDL
ncbi:HPr family phosphocarrier protein [Peptoniphilus obesi]|uniref:HPr family phosphocarrier protein n=1 Tax=Peptoniphilus obesi TaxID=1472765 RepID=UPI0004AE7BE7|nr:HPr family phosphocarrier protein [Peptoniphilus obesi]